MQEDSWAAGFCHGNLPVNSILNIVNVLRLITEELKESRNGEDIQQNGFSRKIEVFSNYILYVQEMEKEK